MLGIVVGFITSLVIFVFFSKDQKAINEYRNTKQQQQRKKNQQQAQRQRILNDPINIQRYQQHQKQLRQRLLKGLNEQDRQLMQKYLDKGKTQGKTQTEMMKSASMKAFFFMVALVLVIIGLVVAMVSLSDVDLSAALQKIKTIVGVVYPRIRDDYRSEQL